ncbi:unnamed protein product [Blepharisma stoltei]|uniref:SF-assemblin n=1 Tax=Blepharisma stoltei TaxID=1481888 RepID=A0AAU9JKG1_9CILI|nr:unnamed protein product [Blepharisma stoltei]
MSFSSFSSLHQDRILQISSRLAAIQTGLETDNGSRADQLEQKCKDLEHHLWESEEQNSKKFSAHKAQLDSILDSLSRLKESRETYFDSKVNELTNLELALKRLLSESDQEKRDSDTKFQKIFDDRINSVQADLARESQLRGDSLKNIKNFLDEKISGIEEMMKNDKIELGKTEGELNEKINESVGKMQEVMENESKAREDTEEAMLVMLQDLIAKIKNEIEQERNERENSEDTLLGLLEETCAKLNSLTNI